MKKKSSKNNICKNKVQNLNKIIACQPDTRFITISPENIKEYLYDLAYNFGQNSILKLANNPIEEIEKTSEILKNLAKKALDNLQNTPPYTQQKDKTENNPLKKDEGLSPQNLQNLLAKHREWVLKPEPAPKPSQEKSEKVLEIIKNVAKKAIEILPEIMMEILTDPEKKPNAAPRPPEHAK